MFEVLGSLLFGDPFEFRVGVSLSLLFGDLLTLGVNGGLLVSLGFFFCSALTFLCSGFGCD